MSFCVVRRVPLHDEMLWHLVCALLVVWQCFEISLCARGQTWNGDVVLLGPEPLGQVGLQVLVQDGIVLAHGRHGLGQAGQLRHRSLLLPAQTASFCQDMLPKQWTLFDQKT